LAFVLRGWTVAEAAYELRITRSTAGVLFLHLVRKAQGLGPNYQN
jgi:hypothetical protein